MALKCFATQFCKLSPCLLPGWGTETNGLFRSLSGVGQAQDCRELLVYSATGWREAGCHSLSGPGSLVCGLITCEGQVFNRRARGLSPTILLLQKGLDFKPVLQGRTLLLGLQISSTSH
jgi:hypothetical protein